MAAGGKHRRGTHSVWFAGLMFAVAWLLSLWPFGEVLTVYAGFYLAALAIGQGGKARHVYYFSGAVVGTWARFHYLHDRPALLVPLGVGVGCLAHLVGDLISKEGVPLFYTWGPMFSIFLIGLIMGEHALAFLCLPAIVWLAYLVAHGVPFWSVPWAA